MPWEEIIAEKYYKAKAESRCIHCVPDSCGYVFSVSRWILGHPTYKVERATQNNFLGTKLPKKLLGGVKPEISPMAKVVSLL